MNVNTYNTNRFILLLKIIIQIYRILQVTGTFTLSTSDFKMPLATSVFVKSAAPIPPLIENSFGHPILISMPATSFST